MKAPLRPLLFLLLGAFVALNLLQLLRSLRPKQPNPFLAPDAASHLEVNAADANVAAAPLLHLPPHPNNTPLTPAIISGPGTSTTSTTTTPTNSSKKKKIAYAITVTKDGPFVDGALGMFLVKAMLTLACR